jgi:hypothetical protein
VREHSITNSRHAHAPELGRQRVDARDLDTDQVFEIVRADSAKS